VSDREDAPKRPPLTPERWRAVDAVLQRALDAEPSGREAVVAEACGDDAALRGEVDSLLASHVALDDAFLPHAAPPLLPLAERYADERERGEPSRVEMPEGSAALPGRHVSGRAAMYVALVALIVGFGGGLIADRAFFLRRPAASLPAVNVPFGSSAASAAPLSVVDRGGRVVMNIAAMRPWTPRFSPDGRRVAYGAFGEGRETSDLWVTELDQGTTRRVTDDDADANDPQWSADGTMLAYSASAPGGKDVMIRALAGTEGRVVASRAGVQFPSDWVRGGGALLVTEEAGDNRHDILVQPADGSPARQFQATRADETAARMSPDGRWVAYTSDVSGRPEVYVESYPDGGNRVRISASGGMHPVWRGDGRELFYWRDGALLAAALEPGTGSAAPVRRSEAVLFRAPYPGGVSTMYDVSPDGQRFVIAR